MSKASARNFLRLICWFANRGNIAAMFLAFRLSDEDSTQYEPVISCYETDLGSNVFRFKLA
jgi:hypothetical protein